MTPEPTTIRIALADEVDISGFRREARALLARDVPPDRVLWQVAGTDGPELFFEAAPATVVVEQAHPAGPAPHVPPAFLTLCKQVVLHREPQRFALLYRLLWRLMHEPGLRHDPIDPDRVQAQEMAQSVRRDMHKMTAFVRFRPIAGPAEEAGVNARPTLHVAWFEPEHHIVEALAPFFVRRFTQMHWAILCPQRSVRWDGRQLHFGPGGMRHDAPPADAGEALWLTYYRSIFNPARLKMKMMQKEMPRKYWHNLPEARLISPLAAQAQVRSGRMIEQAATRPERVIRPQPDQKKSLISPHIGVDSFEALRKATDRCRECPIGEFATQAVCGEGPKRAPLMFVGEQPGDQEDLRGRPFVGPAGQLFDRGLAQIGLGRQAVFISNAVRHFKFELRGKRRIHKTPTQREAAACLHWLEDEIRLVQPAALVALGATAARSLLGRQVSVMAERGHWLTRPDGRKVLVTLHPSALLRTEPTEREAAFDAWVNDLKKAQRGAV